MNTAFQLLTPATIIVTPIAMALVKKWQSRESLCVKAKIKKVSPDETGRTVKINVTCRNTGQRQCTVNRPHASDDVNEKAGSWKEPKGNPNIILLPTQKSCGLIYLIQEPGFIEL